MLLGQGDEVYLTMWFPVQIRVLMHVFFYLDEG